MFNAIKRFFKKKSNIEKEIQKEEKIVQEIIQDNQQITSSVKITAQIIKYVMEDEDAVPQIIKIGDFYNEVIPEPNSIIWAPTGKKLTPYKVVRYDFIEDPDLEKGLASTLYIVVYDALNSDILRTNY